MRPMSKREIPVLCRGLAETCLEAWKVTIVFLSGGRGTGKGLRGGALSLSPRALSGHHAEAGQRVRRRWRRACHA